MALESRNPNPPSPELEDLRSQVAELNARVDALERNRLASPTAMQGSSESKFGLTLVNRVGAVTLALGILFFFKYAAENNWIGPVARVLLGVLFGFGFLGFGERLTRRNQGALAYGITACGICILYIAIYASAVYYKLLLHGASFLLMVATCALCVLLGLRYRNQSLASFGFGLLAFTLPLMHGEQYVGFRPIYLLVSAAVGLAIAVSETWSILPLFNAFAVLLAGLVPKSDPVSYSALCFFMAAGSWIAGRFRKSAAQFWHFLYVATHILVLIGGLRLISAFTHETSVALTLASLLLTVYGIGLLAFGASRNSQVDRTTGFSLIALVILKLYLYDVWQLNYAFRITAFVALGVLLLGASFIYSRYKTRT